MTLFDLFNANGDWKSNVTFFEIHPTSVDGDYNSKVLFKGFWNDIPMEMKDREVIYFESINRNKIYIELDD